MREFRRIGMKVMKHMARLLIEEGRPKDARRCLARLIPYQPTSPKAYRRYLKTFLPARMPPTTSSTKDSEACLHLEWHQRQIRDRQASGSSSRFTTATHPSMPLCGAFSIRLLPISETSSSTPVLPSTTP